MKTLLGEPYTSRVSEEIARTLRPEEVRAHSSSIARFELAVRNGPSPALVSGKS